MKKLLAAAFVASMLLPAGVAGAADGRCYTAAAMEADQAYHFIIDLMVASTACRDQSYGLFQQRNQASIRAYQKTMVTHLHGNAAFDAWDTSLANEASMKHAGQSTAQACQQAADIIKMAGTLDDKGFRAYAAAAAAKAIAQYHACGGR
jgi:hypothetical protein